MKQALQNRNDLLHMMAYVFLYSDDPSQLDPPEQKAFRDDIMKILDGVEEEISLSVITVQRNWFSRAKEKYRKGLFPLIRSNFAKPPHPSHRPKIFSDQESVHTSAKPILL